MYRFYSLKMHGERKTEVNPQELEDDFDEKDDFFQPEESWDDEYDDEAYEREYCD